VESEVCNWANVFLYVGGTAGLVIFLCAIGYAGFKLLEGE
jgi:hypothetical protein